MREFGLGAWRLGCVVAIMLGVLGGTAGAQNATATNMINTCNPNQPVSSISPSSPATSTVGDCLVGGGSSSVFRPLWSLFLSNGDPTVGFQYQGDDDGAGLAALIGINPSSATNSFESSAATVDFAVNEAAASRFVLAGVNGKGATITSGPLSCAPNAYCYQPNPAPPAMQNSLLGAPDGPLLQIPLFIEPIAVTTHFSKAQINRTGAFQFTPYQLCGIFSGKITVWNDPALYNVLANGGPMPTGYIQVLYDVNPDSGTTWAFTTYLSGVCNESNSAITFKPTGDFGSLFGNCPPIYGYKCAHTPMNFFGFSGSDGIASAEVKGGVVVGGNPANDGGQISNDRNISYVGIGWTSLPSANAGQGFPAAAAIQLGSTYYIPSPANASVALAADPANPGGGQAAPANPDDLTTYGPNPTSTTLPSAGYPISIFVYATFPQCFALDANSQNTLFNLGSFLYNVYSYGQETLSQYGLTAIQGPLLSAALNVVNDTGDPQIGLGDASVCPYIDPNTGAMINRTTTAATFDSPGTGSGRVAVNPPP